MGRDYISAIVAAKEAFSSGKTKDVKFRKQQLQKLFKCVRDNEVRWCEALKKDLNKSKTEAVSAEIILVNNEIVTAIKNLDQWVKNEPKKKELATITADIYTRKEPFGTCLIMSAWNYPFLLMLAPMIGAIAAGNCVVIKPSECAAHTAKLLQELLPQYIDPTCYPVIVLDAKDSADLVTNNRFDFIFFTGGTAIGRIVMKAAAEYLTPVVLELGDPKHSPDYGRIINERQTLRLKKVIESGAGKIVVGGEVDVKERYVAPTVVTDIPADSAYMQQEMFGPILLVVTVKDMDEAIAVVNSREKPLAMYIFAKNKKLVNKILSNTSSGGVTVNDVVMHYVPHSLPFGGVGESGMGAYHGKHTFDTFSHRRSCLVDGNPEFFNSLRYPPHSQKKLSIIRLVLMKNMQKPGFVAFLQSLVGLALFGVLIACAVRLFVQL
uniref:fatty aldehyde dehydrogenase-like isoform X2 n=1 Tax=Ciona intestinalis TaxID=7719 RepID=UPI000EF53E41|nr:fatty aldehyde dehydrogenase-like isoform X2 [Ciona intestinalis]|eukprot:XP_026689510.1 fatty aldehyde dehydrogenase-like isoform X2 [Ciona intestinalis]